MTRSTPNWYRLKEFVLGGLDNHHLPERVRGAIARQEQSSEILVGWVQAALVLFFFAFYAIAPKTSPSDAPFEPVPITLGIYGVFTAFRLWLAHRRRLGRIVLGASVIIDMAMLMSLIWSFHLQYEQPPAFYLKASTLLYVFIWIALRTLRFDPGLVLLAGAAASLFWLALVAYAARYDPGGMPITRDYIHYMTSSSILIGAEVDKIVSIIIVSLILALALVRARRLLINAVSERAAARDLSRFFDPEVAAQIVQSERSMRSGEGALRPAAAMFIDMRGFTSLAQEMEPSSLMQLLGEYQARLVPVIQSCRGTVDKYLGDGILASFGATSPSDTYAADALTCVGELCLAIDDWTRLRHSLGRATPAVGIGVATGSLLVGAIGDGSRLEYTVIGEPVNLAAKFEKHTKVERVRALTSTSSFALAVQQGYSPSEYGEIRLAREVAGISQPLDLVVLAAK